MGERSEFTPGYEAPNTGVYIEVGAHPDSGDLHNPKRIHLHKGEKFPETTNSDRKWRRIKTNKRH
ncbi:YjzC family protein [Alicyclobacillus acidiphilus]|jgi:hypothetical protein|uniref:YjzC family protein n=1 Tax=Alicyclobacillus acidiphilus TaxID=182455 RepID=UPI00082C363C|nr:YjzC family protein [Alicyclobacillus acidiphilus]